MKALLSTPIFKVAHLISRRPPPSQDEKLKQLDYVAKR